MLQRNCPECNCCITYTNITKFKIGTTKNSLCEKCKSTFSCSSCGDKKVYSSMQAKNQAISISSLCKTCQTKDSFFIELNIERKKKKRENQLLSWTDERKAERSKKYTGEGNPFYGKTHDEQTRDKFRIVDKSYTKTTEFSKSVSEGMADSEIWKEWCLNPKGLLELWKEKLSDEEALSKEIVWRKKLSDANSGENNPMFGKPAPFKAGNGTQGWYNNQYFRSLRELTFILKIESEGKKWKSGESQEYRIPYTINGINRNYFPDFIVDDTEMVECKPAYLINTESVLLKTEAAINFCNKRKMTYTIMDPGYMSTDDLYELINCGKVILCKSSKLS